MGILNNIIGGAGSAIGSGLVSQAFGKLDAKNNFNQWRKMTDYVNQYNSPSNQINLLRAAGINPASAFMNGSTIDASSSESAQPVNNSSNYQQNLNAAMQNSLLGAQIRNIEADTHKKESEIDKTDLEVIGQEILNSFLPAKLKSEVNENDANAKKLCEDAGLLSKQSEKYIELIDSQINKIKSDTDKNVQETYNSYIDSIFKPSLVSAQIRESVSQSSLNFASAEAQKRYSDLMEEQIHLIHENAKVVGAQAFSLEQQLEVTWKNEKWRKNAEELYQLEQSANMSVAKSNEGTAEAAQKKNWWINSTGPLGYALQGADITTTLAGRMLGASVSLSNGTMSTTSSSTGTYELNQTNYDSFGHPTSSKSVRTKSNNSSKSLNRKAFK